MKPYQLFLVSTLAIAGCASTKPDNRAQTLDTTVISYCDHLRWGHYEAAAAFRNPHFKGLSIVREQALKNIHISAYEIVDRKIILDKNAARIDVVLDYYRDDDATAHVERDEQSWSYSTVERRWYLDGDLPKILTSSQ